MSECVRERGGRERQKQRQRASSRSKFQFHSHQSRDCSHLVWNIKLRNRNKSETYPRLCESLSGYSFAHSADLSHSWLVAADKKEPGKQTTKRQVVFLSSTYVAPISDKFTLTHARKRCSALTVFISTCGKMTSVKAKFIQMYSTRMR